MSAECRSCGAPILWALTSKGKRMPVDAEPVEDGNLILLEVEGRRYARPVINEMLEPEPRYRSHFATCPNAAEHRKT